MGDEICVELGGVNKEYPALLLYCVASAKVAAVFRPFWYAGITVRILIITVCIPSRQRNVRVVIPVEIATPVTRVTEYYGRLWVLQ
jgi:hypothetical protein